MWSIVQQLFISFFCQNLAKVGNVTNIRDATCWSLNIGSAIVGKGKSIPPVLLHNRHITFVWGRIIYLKLSDPYSSHWVQKCFFSFSWRARKKYFRNPNVGLSQLAIIARSS